ncbi:hypothetical protein Tco_1499220 [Tanacetum coccineum]
METQKPLLKDENSEEVDVHMYRSMIGSLMYLTSSRPDFTCFGVCACARFQVNPNNFDFFMKICIMAVQEKNNGYNNFITEDEYVADSIILNTAEFLLLVILNTAGKAKKSVRLNGVVGELKELRELRFEQIVDFLNAHTIKYALTINPTIYTSCIKQFWATVKAKTVNGEVQLQALVDGKKIIITESIVRRDLQLEDAEGVDCLPNATIFEQLTLMGSKTTAWNEFSSTMASAIICLATNQKFNFSKYIFESMLKNLENVSGKFLMYPRFVQVFLDKQLEGMSNHNRIYVTPSHTKKIFGNMRRVGKGFSGRETPLFPTMVVHNQEEMGEGSAIPTDPHHTPTFIQPSPQPQKKQKPRKPKRKDTQIPQSSGPTEHVADEAVYKELDDSLVRAATTASSLEAEQDSGNINKTQSKATPNEPSSPETSLGGGLRCQETMGDTIAQTRFEDVSKHSNDPLLARGNTLRSGKDRPKLEELMALCTTLQSRVLALETTKTTQANEIANLKRRVKKLGQKKRSITHGLKRLYKVGSSRRLESSGDEGLGEEDTSKQGRIPDIDVDIAGEKRNVVEETVNAAATTVSTASTISISAATTTTTTTVISDDENTLAKALAELKSAKPTPTTTSTRPKAKGIVIHE